MEKDKKEEIKKESTEKDRTIENLGMMYNFESQYNDKIYHNTKLLLKLYSKVFWRMSNSIKEMEAECYVANGNKLYDVVDALIEVDPRVNKARIESRLQSLEDSKSILELIDRALILLKNYPLDGDRYFIFLINPIWYS